MSDSPKRPARPPLPPPPPRAAAKKAAPVVPPLPVPDTRQKPAARLPRPSAPPLPAPSPEPAVEPAEPPSGPHAEIVEVCEAELRRAPDDARAAQLHHEIGRAYEVLAHAPLKALKHYQRALERCPDHVPALRAARRLLLTGNDAAGAVRSLDREIALEKDARQRAYLLVTKGRILEDTLDQADAARRCFTQAAELDPGNATVLEALLQAERRARAWPLVSATLEKLAAATSRDPHHRASLLAQRARLHETHLDDPRTAVELYELALRLDDGVGGALQALKRILHEQGRWQELVAVLEREAASSQDVDVQTAALYRVGRIWGEQLGDREHAIEAVAEAARISPSDPLVLEELARLHAAADRPADLVAVLERLVETIDVPVRRLGVLHRIAELHAERLGAPAAAIARYEAALAIDATYVPALRALSALYAAAGDWDALVRMQLAEAEATSDTPRRAAALSRVGELLEGRLGRPDEAIEHHARALGLQPGHEVSFRALARLYAAGGRHRELVDLYERAAERATEADVAVAYLLKVGTLHEDALGEPGHAVATYRRVLAREPGHLGALHAMQRAAAAAGDDAACLEALEREVEACRDPARMVELLHQAGQLLDERLGRADAALIRYRRVLELDPRHRAVLASLGRLFHRLGRWSDLYAVYGQELELEKDAEARVRLLLRMAELADKQIGDPERALDCWRRALELDPEHGPALHALQRRLRERGDWVEYATVLEQELSRLRTSKARAEVAFSLGETLELRLARLDEAVEAYRRSVAEVPHYRPALDGLARVRTKQKAWAELVELLRDEAGGMREPWLAVEALLRGGEILSERLGQDRAAVGPYEAIRQSLPKQLDALLSLEPLYRKLGDWPALVDVQRARAEACNDPGARVAALVDVARLIAARKLADDGARREAYAAALEHVPTHRIALDELERIALDEHDSDLLADVDLRRVAFEQDPAALADHQARLGLALEATRPDRAIEAFRAALSAHPGSLTAIRGLGRLGRASGDAALRREALHAEAAWTAQPERAAELLIESARVAATGLRDGGAASADLEEALARCPEDPIAADDLQSLLLQLGEIERLLGALGRAAQACTRPARRAELWRMVASLHADRLDDLQAGIVALERVVRDDADDAATRVQLARLYARNGQWREAAAALSRAVELGPEREVLVPALLELARIEIERLDARAAAIGHLESLLRLDAGHREGLELLLEVHARAGDLKAAGEIGRRFVRAAQGADERARALLAIGRVQLRAGEKEAAAGSLREAVAVSGPVGPAADEYRRLLGTDEPWERYAESLVVHRRQVEAGAVEDPQPWATFLELGKVTWDHLGDPQAAARVFRDGIERCGEVPGLYVELAERLRAAGQGAEAIDLLQTLIAREPGQGEGWRALARAFEGLSRPGDASFALGPLVVLGEATDVERRRSEQRKLRPGLAREGAFAPEELRTISAGPGIESHVEALLAALAEAAAKLHPTDFEGYGVTARDRLPERAEDPIRALCDRMLPVFGLERVDVLVHPRRLADVVIEPTVPASLMVPAAIRELPEAQQVFMLARALALVTRGIHIVGKLGWERTAQLVVAATRLVSPGYARGKYDDAATEELGKRIAKASSRRARKLVDEAAQGVGAAPRLDLQEIAEAFLLTANRAGALLAGDLPAVCEVLRRTEPALADRRGRALVDGSGVVADLFRFWVCEPAIDFRRRAGLG
jgi:tetratricopeptide (TPR) repeat protein